MTPYCKQCGKPNPCPDHDPEGAKEAATVAADVRSLVREYKSRTEYERDLATLAPQGFSVVTVTEATQNAGCLRFLAIGFLALIFKPDPHYIVTYERH